jgi:hypothetical protein
VQNTIDILSSINITIKEIAKSMAPQNGSGEAAMAKLSKGNVTTNADVNPAADVAKPNISKANIGDIISVLNTLSPSVLSIAKLSGSKINRFTKVLDTIIKSVNKLSEDAKNNKDAVANIKIITESFDILNNSIGKGSGLVVKAPIATLGLKLANGTIKAIDAILTTVSKMSNVNDRIKKLNNITKAIDPLIKVVTKAALFSGLCMGLGILLMVGPTRDLIIGGLLVFGAVLLTTTTIILLTGLAGQLIKSVGAFAALKDIMTLTLASVLLVAACFGLGMAIEAMGGWKPLMKGLAVVGATLIMLAAVFWIVGMVGKAAASPEIIKSYAGIFALTIASMILIVGAKYLGDYTTEHYESILIGLGYVVGTMLALVGIGWIATQALSSSRQAMIALAALEGLVLGAMALVLVARQLSEITKDHEVDILSAIGLSMSIIVGFGTLATLAGTLQRYIMPGVTALALIELLAAGAIAVAGLVVGLDYIKTQNDITWGDLYIDVLGVMGIITAFGLLAAAASFILPEILLGAAALIPVELLISGAIGVAHLLINLHNVKEEAGINWLDLELDILGVAAIVGTFGLLASAFGLIMMPVLLGSLALVPVELLIVGAIGVSHLLINLHNTITEAGISFMDLEKDILGMSMIMGTFGVLAGAMALLVIPIALGTPGMLAVTGFSILAIGVVNSIVDMSKAIEKAGGVDKITQTLSVDIPAILKNINADNFSVDMGTLTIIKMMAKYALLAELVTSVLTVAESISKIAQIVGIVDDAGRIRQILSIDKETGEVKYGEPVDIKNLSTVIAQTVKTFVENSQYSFEEVRNMYNTREIFEVLSTITEPISKFVEMLTGFTTGDDPNTLATVTIDEKGEVKIGKPVNVKDVAAVIAGAISSFVSELYKKENTENWAELIYGDRTFFEGLFGQTNKRADSVREVAGVLGIIVEPICKFVDMISSLMPGKNGTLRKIFIDKDGKIRTGPEVDVKRTGNVIAELITSFVTAVYKNSDQWKNIDAVKSMSLEKLLKPLNDMVKSATEMSGEKIKADLIRTNTDAIVYFNRQLVISLLSIDTEIVNGKVDVLQSILKIAGGISKLSSERILSNSKSIVSFMTNVVDKKMPKSKPTVDAFKKSIENLKKAFKDLDTILIKDEDKRTKALDAFEKRIKEIINAFKDGKSAMDSYNETLKNTQNYKTPNYIPAQPSYVPTPYAPTQHNNTVNQHVNNNNNVTFDPSEFAKEFVKALKYSGLTIKPDESNDGGELPVKIITKFKIG